MRTAAYTVVAAHAGGHPTRNTILFVLVVIVVCGLFFSGNKR